MTWDKIHSETLNLCCNSIAAMANGESLESFKQHVGGVFIDANCIMRVFAAIFRNFEQNNAWSPETTIEMLEILIEGMPHSKLLRPAQDAL